MLGMYLALVFSRSTYIKRPGLSPMPTGDWGVACPSTNSRVARFQLGRRERSIGWMSFSSQAYLTKSAPDSRLSTGATRMRSARAWADGLSHGLTVIPVRLVNSWMIGSRRLKVAPTTFSSLLWAKAAGLRAPSVRAPAVSTPPFKRLRRVVLIVVTPFPGPGPAHLSRHGFRVAPVITRRRTSRIRAIAPPTANKETAVVAVPSAYRVGWSWRSN